MMNHNHLSAVSRVLAVLLAGLAPLTVEAGVAQQAVRREVIRRVEAAAAERVALRAAQQQALSVERKAAMRQVLVRDVRRDVRRDIAKPVVKPIPLRAPGKPHDIILQRSKHPEAAAHAEHAQRNGQPTVLHIDRAGAAERRAAATGTVSLKRKPAPHYERDEYPPAMTREGGFNSNVRFVSRHDNRSAGAAIRAQTSQLPDGTKIRVLVAD